MIRIAITAEAYEAIKATLSVGSVSATRFTKLDARCNLSGAGALERMA
jgi:hypothetical protein